MSNYNSLKATIDANIKQNGNQEITGQILNSVLNQMVTTLGTGYQFAGVATIATNPGTPDAKVFYIANGKGTYEKFGGLEVTEDDVVVFYYDTAWHKVSTGIASNQKLTELENKLYEDKTIDYQDGVYEILAGYENHTPLKAMIAAGTVIKEVKKEDGGIANVFYFLKENGSLITPVVQPAQLPYTLAENAYFLTSNRAMNITLVYEKTGKEAKFDIIAKGIENTNKNIGNLENLNTVTKDSIVNAINEVKASIPEPINVTTDTVIDTESGKTQKDINRELGNAIEDIVPTKTEIITDNQDGQLSNMSIRINGLVVSSNFWYIRYKTFEKDTNVHCKAIGINVWYAVSDTLPNIDDYLVSFKVFTTDGEEADILVPKGKYFLYSYFNKGTIRLEISTSTKAKVATKDEIPSLEGYAKLTDIERKVTIADKKVLVMGDSISTKVYGRYNKWVEPLIAEGFFPNIAPEGGDYQWLYSECYNSIHATGFVTDGAYAGATRTGDDFLTRLKAISDPSTFDYVIVFGGVNDYIQGVSFNEPKGNYKSFKSALQEFFEYLCTNFINASIMVITPLYVWNHDTVKGEGDEDVYIEAIRNEAKKYHLPVLDSANDACFYPDVPIFKATWTHEGDGVHPNEEWCRKHLSQYIKSFICRHL